MFVDGASVVVAQGILRVEANELIIVLDGKRILPQLFVGAAPVVVGLGKLGVEADGLIEVLDGSLILT